MLINNLIPVNRSRSPEAEFLRTHTQTILARLLRQSPMHSKNYLRNMVRTTKLYEIVEFFHAFLGFCVDPTSLLSPLSEYILKICFIIVINFTGVSLLFYTI